MKALTITAQPKPEADWVHRFRNFGEEIYVQLRTSCEVDIAEIDASFDEFHVNQVRDEDVDAVSRTVASFNRAHHLDDSVFVLVSDAPVHLQTVVLILDTSFGDRLWEIAWRHPIWIVPSESNSATLAELDRAKTNITIWSNALELASERNWLGVLNTLDMHHGAFASEPPMNKLSVYGAVATKPVVAALREFGFESVLPTASGFIALQPYVTVVK